MRDGARAAFVDLAIVTAVKITASVAVIAMAFRAVSDDDFARVVIAEEWARSPRWDASGTSWLPFPFWITGAAMIALGRSLAVARGVAFVLGLAAVWLVYLAARWIGEERRYALIGASLAAAFPWSARLGVATVPELSTAALTLLGIAAIASPHDDTRSKRLFVGSLALAAASLSRYEAWPVAIAFAAIASVDAARTRRIQPAIAASLALLGPASWLVNNRLAHGDALHFLARVAAYKQALGGAETTGASRLVAYPWAMVREEPEIVVAAVLACLLVAAREGREKLFEALAKHKLPVLLVAAQIAALSLAMIKDGAPTHHPERAVLTAFLLLAVIAGSMTLRTARAEHILMVLVSVTMASIFLRAKNDTFTPRADEVAVGRAAAAIAKPGDRVLVEVVDYGYLAVTAAFGRPEDVVADRSIDPRAPKQPSSFAAEAAIRDRLTTSAARYAIAKPEGPIHAMLGPPLVTHGAWGLFDARDKTP